MTARPRGQASDLGTASAVVLCMSVSAAVALAIEAVWLWVPWIIVTLAVLLAAGLATVSRRASHRHRAPDPREHDRGRRSVGARERRR